MRDLVNKSITFQAPSVRVVYENIAPEAEGDPNFLEPLKKLMRRRGVPEAAIKAMFALGAAAPTPGGLQEIVPAASG